MRFKSPNRPSKRVPRHWKTHSALVCFTDRLLPKGAFKRAFKRERSVREETRRHAKTQRAQDEFPTWVLLTPPPKVSPCGGGTGFHLPTNMEVQTPVLWERGLVRFRVSWGGNLRTTQSNPIRGSSFRDPLSQAREAALARKTEAAGWGEQGSGLVRMVHSAFGADSPSNWKEADGFFSAAIAKTVCFLC